MRKKTEKVTCKEALFLWLEFTRNRIKESTYSKYRFLIERHIVPKIGEISLEKLDCQVINNFISDKLKKGRIDGDGGLSAGYVNTVYYILQAALKQRHGNIKCFEYIDKPQAKRKVVDHFSLNEQIKLEKYILKNIDEKNIGIIISLYTGLRIGEICALRWDDVNFEEKTFRVNSTVTRVKDYQKNRTELKIGEAKTFFSQRIVPFPKKINDILKNVSRKSEYIISGKKYPYTDTRNYQYYFKKVLQESEVRKVNFHILRHTFATRCIEAGMDIKTLSEILGHSSVNITLTTYVHSTMEHKMEQIEKMVSLCEKNS